MTQIARAVAATAMKPTLKTFVIYTPTAIPYS